ncbi:MAG: toxin-antitoxin system HicB family antitoxin [Melioribacteraceae bacterium]
MKKDLSYYINLPYKVEIEFEPIEGVWIASHPELGKGSCYAIADTPEEAIELLKNDKQELLEILLTDGKSIPEPKFEKEEELPSGQFILRIPKTLHKKVKDQAELEGVSLNHFLSTLIAEKFTQNYQSNKFTEEVIAAISKQLSTVTSFNNFSQPNVNKPIFSFENKEETSELSLYNFGVSA